ncbi:MAG: HAD family hydrolase [Candidatus Thermoplasmatota archaeon]|nr:HAD family hydrolase [Candidatus Thermoplasmatota archaeon]
MAARTMNLPPVEDVTPPSLVLFDLDDTLFDDRYARLAALRDLRGAEPVLARRPLSALSREYGRLLDAGYPAVMSGDVPPEEARALRFERLAMYCGERISAARAAEWAARYRMSHEAHRRAVPGSRRLIERLGASARIGVVTNWVHAEQREKLRAIGLEGVVDFLVAPDTAHATKPDPRIFRHALREGRSRPERAVMVGDSLVYDVRGARACGIRPIWLNRWKEPAPPGENVDQLSSFVPTSRVLERIVGRR